MKIKFTPVSLLVCLLIVTALSCDETTIVKNYTGTGEEKTYSIEGYAQKGPFIVGTDVTVSELSEDLYPTGRVFFATILNDEGYFELPGVVLESRYVQIKIRGRYFSETGGYVPSEELTLYSLADVTNSESINVNILTHLEKERVEYLVQQENKSFNEAKAQAQAEILEVFEWEDISVDQSEQLDLSDNSTSGAILLAMSSLFDVIDFVKRLETITSFKIDFANDGTLNTTLIQNRLVTAATALNRSIIRDNMESKYDTEMPDFESMLDLFINNSSYTNHFDSIFPKTYNGYTNLFRQDEENLDASKNYAFIIGPYPVNTVAGQVNHFFMLEVRFATTAEFPNVSANNFTFVDSPEQLSFSVGEGYCNDFSYCAVAIWGKDFNGDNSDPYVLPIEYTGAGKLDIQFQWDIDHVNISRLHRLSW